MINNRDTTFAKIILTIGKIFIIVILIQYLVLILASITTFTWIFIPFYIVLFLSFASLINEIAMKYAGLIRFRNVYVYGPFDIFKTEQYRKLEPDEKTPWPEDFKKEIRELIREKNRKSDGKKNLILNI